MSCPLPSYSSGEAGAKISNIQLVVIKRFKRCFLNKKQEPFMLRVAEPVFLQVLLDYISHHPMLAWADESSSVAISGESQDSLLLYVNRRMQIETLRPFPMNIGETKAQGCVYLHESNFQ